MTSKYDWITTEMFNNKLGDLVEARYTAKELLRVPGIYEILQEELNNEVLEELEEEREERENIKKLQRVTVEWCDDNECFIARLGEGRKGSSRSAEAPSRRP